MPIYDHECKKCKINFEVIKPLSESEKKAKCPGCDKLVPKVFCTVNSHGTMTFVLKGWGWANDGYDGVTKRWKDQKEVFNRDGSLVSQEGKKDDWPTKLSFDMKPTKKPGTKPGRKKIV